MSNRNRIINNKFKLNKINNLYFYNNYHNGDIHYSQMFINDISKKLKWEKCYYLHNNDSKILKHLTHIRKGTPNEHCDDNKNVFYVDNNLYVNTWIGQNNLKYVKIKDCSIYSNLELFKNIYKILKIKMEIPSFYIPEINYDYYNIKNINDYLKDNKKLKVLISNGKVLSNQSVNFDFNPIIKKLSEEFNNVDFILTNDTKKLYKNNILYTNDIIKINDCDLNEISYLSTYCDIIVGRCSCPYCFTHVKKNYYNYNKVFIGLCKSYWETCWFNVKNCKFINNNNNNYDADIIYDLIKEEIDKKLLII